jgi:D-glycero-D-manno-heptose 1,7-bisphosphate phosphatase
MKRALFLDRDGVINVDHAYVHQIENFHFIDGIFELVAAAKSAGYLVVVITNQAGIGRGYYTEQVFLTLMTWVKQQFLQHQGDIDKVYFCPYHPVHGLGNYKKESSFRKPGPGMLLAAAQELAIDMQGSVMVGDKSSDCEAGTVAGVGTVLLLSEQIDQNPWYQVRKLRDVISFL